MCSGSNKYLASLLRCCRDQKSGKIIHGFIVRTGFYSDTYLSNRLMDVYCGCGDVSDARKMFYEMHERDIYSWNTFLNFSCKAGNLEEACKVFNEMPETERDVVSWNNMISVLVRNGLEEKALIVYEKMVSQGFMPSRFTLASVFSACSKIPDVVTGMRCHGVSVKTGLDKNIFVANALLSMYAKCGLTVDHGIRVFESLGKPNEVSFTTVINGLARENKVLEAVNMFRSMCMKGIQVDSVCLSNILSISGSVLWKQIHSLALRLGLLRDLHLNNSLLETYAKSDDMNGAERIFTEMHEVNVVSWNIMIAGFDKPVEYLERMRESGFEPNEVTWISVLGACFRSGDVETVRRIFDTIHNPSVTVCNAMLSGYYKYEYYEEAINHFRQMQSPDRTTLSVILSSCARLRFLEGGKQIHAVAIRNDISKNNHIVNGLIGVYSECEKIKIIECIFNDCINESDVACWNSMISGLSRNSLDEKALLLFRRMLQSGFLAPNETSYAIVLSSCSRLCSLLHGRELHGHVVKNGYVTDSYVETTITDMYCKCGEIDSARAFFDEVSVKNTVLWNEMMHGYAHNGRGHEAVELYREMINPDGITFVSVLTACSHSGLVDTGMEILNSMERDYGIEPVLDHYVCIVDCLGRAGRVEDAEMLVEATPYKNSFVLWEILLSSCRVHGNLSLARRVAEKLINLDPRNSAAYVQLRNTYTGVKQWNESTVIQELMNKNRVYKTPGHSWIT